MTHDPGNLSGPMKWLVSLLGILVIGVIASIAAIGWGVKYYNSASDLEQPTTVLIPKGSSFQQISEKLHAEGVIEHPQLFRISAYVLGKMHRAQAGEYAFSSHISPREVLDSLVEGRTVIHRLTIPEGLTTHQIMEIVSSEEKLEGPLPTDVTEGELLPETYHFTRGDMRAEVVARMRRDMKNALMGLWEQRQKDLPLRTPQEALVLASIVERETGLSNEYPIVASVYLNRLRKGMLLQADPTVIYAVTNGKENFGRPITRTDLRMDSPYNTYKYAGLPPTPIANPGLGAIEGVLNPATTDYIFFVANGKGGHNFSKTLKQHNSFVQEFRTLLKKQTTNAKEAVKEIKDAVQEKVSE